MAAKRGYRKLNHLVRFGGASATDFAIRCAGSRHQHRSSPGRHVLPAVPKVVSQAHIGASTLGCVYEILFADLILAPPRPSGKSVNHDNASVATRPKLLDVEGGCIGPLPLMPGRKPSSDCMERH